jgi:hypothetical protein
MDTEPSNLNLIAQTPTSASNAYGPTYISGRKRYSRPQAMLWSDNSGNIVDGVRFPLGIEKEDFIILSDHNREEISISQQRIEHRQRMINGTMRSYHIADKITLSCNWQRLPSRSYSRNIIFNASGQPQMIAQDLENTVDGGAGGVEMLDWYENHQDPFWVYLSYDKYNNNSFKVGGKITDQSFQYLPIYNDVRLMYFSSFEYSIEKRGGSNFDMWNISVSLEEA